MRRAGGRPLGRAAAAAVAALLVTGCANPVQPGAPASPSAPARSLPPLAADLTTGVPVTLGAAGHWVITGKRAFTAADGGIDSIDLTTGATQWHASFPSALDAWDAEPTVGLTADGAAVIALRTVDSPTGPALDLLTVDATTGAITGNRVLTPPGRWRVDLPPRILTADATGIVLADNPEAGSQVGAVTLPAGTLAWRVDDQGLTAGDLVITRSGARNRATGETVWESTFPLGPLIGQTTEVVVAEDDASHRVVWLDRDTGRQVAAIDAGPETCAAAATAVICLGTGEAGYDLSSGRPLWSRPDRAAAVTTYRDWAYLERGDGRGDVLDARSGEVVVRDAELPRIRYSNAAGILVDDGGYAWVTIG